MKNKGCITAVVPLCVFGGAVIGMILMIVGGETRTMPLMIVGGIVVAAGVVVGVVVNAILRNIEKNNSSSSVGSAAPDAPVPAADGDDDEDEDEMTDERLESILARGIPEKRSVEALMDREDALTELMARRGMTELNEKYVEEADPLWDTYSGEYMSEAVDNLFELVYRYYALYKEQSTAREEGAETQASVTPPAAESENKEASDRSYTARTEAPPAPAFAPPPEPIRSDAPAPPHAPTHGPSAAVGYKPMKKK